MKAVMYRECLLNQVTYIAGKIDDKVAVSEPARLLYDAVTDGYTSAILFWEIAAGYIPQGILVLPRKEQDLIVKYIRKYVYDKAK